MAKKHKPSSAPPHSYCIPPPPSRYALKNPERVDGYTIPKHTIPVRTRGRVHRALKRIKPKELIEILNEGNIDFVLRVLYEMDENTRQVLLRNQSLRDELSQEYQIAFHNGQVETATRIARLLPEVVDKTA